LGNPKPIQKIRKRIIPLAQGHVLEIGVGAGANFAHYDPRKVGKLYALEPNPGMLRLAEQQRRRAALDVEFLDVPGERILLADGSVDTVVSTFTLCTIPDVSGAIRALGRVLKTGGTLIFFELTVATDADVRRGQERWEPIHHSIFGGLYLTRDIPSLIMQGGFQMKQVESAYLSALKSWSHCGWGSALWERTPSKEAS
jgi:ubiquinone/menaquinone biosynthesis C-methylase UbiE